MVLIPGNGTIPEPLTVYSESFMTIAATVSRNVHQHHHHYHHHHHIYLFTAQHK